MKRNNTITISKMCWAKAAFIMLLLAGLNATAQQAPYYTNFMFNKLPYNAGYAGSKNAICATVLLHQQWQGYSATGAPSTQFANVNAPFAKKHGIGLGVVSDNLGYEKTLTAHLYYNYKFTIGTNGTLGVGPSLGMVQKNIDGSKLVAETSNDPNVPVSSTSSMKPDLGFGAYYTNTQLNNMFAGVSANNINQSTMSYDVPGGLINYQLKRHYYIMAGFTYDINQALTLTPSLLYKSDLSKGQIDVNADLLYNNKIRGGITYRNSDAISILVGYKVSDNFHIGYSYDITTSKLNTVSNGTHEIVVNYCFKIVTKPKVEKRAIRLTPRYM